MTFSYQKNLGRQKIQSVIRHKPLGNQKFQPLPQPTGMPPYHLPLDKILSADKIESIINSKSILFHVAGDTGGIKHPVPQQIVAMAMESDFNSTDINKPAFFYHLGDVVYYFGQSSEYYPQFYEPYTHYPAPIFAIPGNHDGDVAPGDRASSLSAFVTNFCAKKQQVTPDAVEVDRSAMIQPNVYFTLEIPFATIIGLYSNVPEGGEFEKKQIDWFVNELRTAPKDKSLIVSVHHPAYSVDVHHSGSKVIEETLYNAFSESGRFADIVLAGHVHNYQRFTREIDERQIPYLVVGAGGYWHLHYMQKQPNGDPIKVPYKMPDSGVTLESYCENRHGYMIMQVTPDSITGKYFTVPRPQESWRGNTQQIDSFTLNLQNHRLTRDA